MKIECYGNNVTCRFTEQEVAQGKAEAVAHWVRQAAAQINADFRLGIAVDEPPDYRAVRERERVQRERQKRDKQPPPPDRPRTGRGLFPQSGLYQTSCSEQG